MTIEEPSGIKGWQAWLIQNAPLRLTSMTCRKPSGVSLRGRDHGAEPGVVDQHVHAAEAGRGDLGDALAVLG